MTTPGQPTSVYGAYNHAGQLIYVGIAHNPQRRWAQHRTDKPWSCEVHQWRELARYPTRTQAKTHETWIITNTPTRWNIDGSPLADQASRLYRDLYHCHPGTNLPHTPPPHRHAPAAVRRALDAINTTYRRVTRNHRQ